MSRTIDSCQQVNRVMRPSVVVEERSRLNGQALLPLEWGTAVKTRFALEDCDA
jgi:hypothetical protein